MDKSVETAVGLDPRAKVIKTRDWRAGSKLLQGNMKVGVLKAPFWCWLSSYCVHLVLNAGCGQYEERRGDKS